MRGRWADPGTRGNLLRTPLLELRPCSPGPPSPALGPVREAGGSTRSGCLVLQLLRPMAPWRPHPGRVCYAAAPLPDTAFPSTLRVLDICRADAETSDGAVGARVGVKLTPSKTALFRVRLHGAHSRGPVGHDHADAVTCPRCSMCCHQSAAADGLFAVGGLVITGVRFF
jgi:hypothetical protein